MDGMYAIQYLLMRRFDDQLPLFRIVFLEYLSIHHGHPDLILNMRQETLLYTACLFGREQFVRLLLKMGADPNKPNLEGESPLHVVIRCGHCSLVPLLLQFNANPHAYSSLPGTFSFFFLSFNISLSLSLSRTHSIFSLFDTQNFYPF
jgi:hypothetical protein